MFMCVLALQAVPAHVLAQSLYHPNNPSDRARARQLQEDLRVARMDRMLVIKERVSMEAELKRVYDAMHDLERTVRHLSSENTALQVGGAGQGWRAGESAVWRGT